MNTNPVHEHNPDGPRDCARCQIARENERSKALGERTENPLQNLAEAFDAERDRIEATHAGRTPVEQCPQCGGKIRNGECRDCAYRPGRLDEIALTLTEGGGPTVDLVVELANMLPTGAEFDEVRTRLGTLYDVNSVEGLPEGAVIVNGLDGPAGPYAIALDGTYRDLVGFATYGEALARLRAVVEFAVVGEANGEIGDVPVTYLNMRTGLKIELPRLPDIGENWDRPANPEHEQFFAMSAGSVGVEAFCALCGETCNPHGIDEMTHNVRLQSDEQPCGGPLVPVGWWK